MTFFPKSSTGYYDENGTWQRGKHCFVYCGDARCDCRPPNGVYQLKVTAPMDTTQTKDVKVYVYSVSPPLTKSRCNDCDGGGYGWMGRCTSCGGRGFLVESSHPIKQKEEIIRPQLLEDMNNNSSEENS